MPEDNKTQDQAGNTGGNDQEQDSSQDNNKDKTEDKKPMDPAKKRRLIVIGVLVGIILIVGIVIWLIHSSTYTTTDDAQVDGHLDSIASRVNGTVIGVYAENNQPVKAGQLLVKLDPKDLEATAEQSKAKYEEAVAKLAMDFPNVPIQENTNIGTNDTDVAQVVNAKAALEGSQRDYDSKVSQLHQAEAASEKAQKDLVRYKQLLDKREIAPSDYDQYISTARQDEATVESNRHSAESAVQTVLERKAQLQQQQVQLHQDQANAPHQTAMKKSQLDSDRASIAAAKAQHDADLLNLSYTEIRSPVDGLASQRNAELASRVNAAQQVMVIVQTQDQWITANFKETQLKKMRVGQHVDMTVDALGRKFTGTVEYMPAATGDRDSLFPPENATGNYVKVVQRLPVRIRFDPNQDGLDEIRPGMSAEAKVNFSCQWSSASVRYACRPGTQDAVSLGDKVSNPQSSDMGKNAPAATAVQALGMEALKELALNLHWSWSHGTDKLWEALDSHLWQTTQNPWVILQTVSKDKIDALIATPDFQEHLSTFLQRKREFFSADAWFQKTHPGAALSAIAYFSMEFMLTEGLPIYSGGLGNVAGDQMKAASDLGVPVVGVGLLWGQGYFRQDFDSEGNQRALYPVNDPGQLPIQPVRRANGEWLRIQLHLMGALIWLRCWQVSVGRTTLYLLDANDFANSASHRGITSELYGGDAEMRLKQEIVLGIGGWRLLRELGLNPEVCHLNEGHAAFAVLERARYYMAYYHVPFDVALTITKAGNMFTTHTAVPAGFDRFSPELCWKYLEHYAKDELALPMENLLALGRQNPDDASEPLNMAYLALRGSLQVSGVSKLHGEVSRQIFQPLFPRWPQSEVPIGSVTNGIHVPTWDSAGADSLWTKACGADRWRDDRPLAEDIRQLSDSELWNMRAEARRAMLTQARDRYARQLSAEGDTDLDVADIFREDTLTVGFARRFATYKRPDLLLHDPDRLIRLLTDSQRPVQLILAGKAHPEDKPGQALIKQWNDFIRRPEVRGHVIFLSDYDMQMAQEMVQGMDLWINTPRRPWEACGTSGMKVLSNGGLNVSELDGWWAEAYTEKVGWAIGDGKEHGEDAAWDAHEVESLYGLLEHEIVSDFYDRDAQGMPSRWLERVRESMATLTPEFSASRAIRDYTNDHYLPAAAGYSARAADDGKLGTDLMQWQRSIARGWDTLCFGKVSVESKDGEHMFHIDVLPGALHPEQFRVELYAEPGDAGRDGENEAKPEILAASKAQSGQSGTILYSVCFPAKRPATDYTARIVPSHAGASVPLEANQVLWQQ